MLATRQDEGLAPGSINLPWPGLDPKPQLVGLGPGLHAALWPLAVILAIIRVILPASCRHPGQIRADSYNDSLLLHNFHDTYLGRDDG